MNFYWQCLCNFASTYAHNESITCHLQKVVVSAKKAARIITKLHVKIKNNF